MTYQVTVTAADREAASPYHDRFCDAFSPPKQACNCGVEKAFARHRIASQEQAVRAAIEAAAEVCEAQQEEAKELGQIQAAFWAAQLCKSIRAIDFAQIMNGLSQ